ncbi:hypothetical protein MKW92_004921, partial [Papaver armeniacum]
IYNIVDMFCNTDVPTGFICSGSSPVIVAVVLHPTPKIIFGVYAEKFGHDGDFDEYYSYDVNLKRLDFITELYGMRCKWHVSSLVLP